MSVPTQVYEHVYFWCQRFFPTVVQLCGGSKVASGQEYWKLLSNKFFATYQWLLFARYFACGDVHLQVLKLVRRLMRNIVRKHDYCCISLASLQPRLRDIFRKCVVSNREISSYSYCLYSILLCC